MSLFSQNLSIFENKLLNKITSFCVKNIAMFKTGVDKVISIFLGPDFSTVQVK